jgi:hypothetical protein
MGVRIDKARRDGQAVDVKRSLRAAIQSSDFGDLAVDYRKVSVITRQPRAVIDSTALKQKIVHGILLSTRL